MGLLSLLNFFTSLPLLLGFFSVLPVLAVLHWLTWRRLVRPSLPADLGRCLLMGGVWWLSLTVGFITASNFWIGEKADLITLDMGGGDSDVAPLQAQVAFFAGLYPYWQIAWLAYLFSRILRSEDRAPAHRGRWARHHGWALPLMAIVIYGGWTAMSSYGNSLAQHRQDQMMRLAFTCTHEADRLPPLDPDADQLFRYARYLEKKKGPKDFNAVARYYRIAAAYGHYKANHNLQLLVSEGQADSPSRPDETIALAQRLIKDGIPGGYYDMAYYLEQGYGVKRDEELALRYYRKAADLGNPEGQYYVGDKLTSLDDAQAKKIGWQMYQCAADQGHRDAINEWAIHLSNDLNKRYAEAVAVFQQGVAAGDTTSALALEEGFKAPLPENRLYYLALPNDPERSQRYHQIRLFFRANDGHNPKVPDIDQIVPLPPAPLPPWDGTFQWQKEQDQAPVPPKPSDALIQRMSKAKFLDPATGLPLSGSFDPKDHRPDGSAKSTLGTKVKTGQICPETGQWCARYSDRFVSSRQYIFRRGQTMPTYERWVPRGWGILGDWMDDLLGRRYEDYAVEWTLVRHVDDAT